MTENDRRRLWNMAAHMRLVAKLGVGLSIQALGEYADAIEEIVGKSIAPPAGTVRVRAAVVVTSDGQWEVRGFCDEEDDEIVKYIGDTLDLATAKIIHWLEADVPLPVPQTIQAEVVT